MGRQTKDNQPRTAPAQWFEQVSARRRSSPPAPFAVVAVVKSAASPPNRHGPGLDQHDVWIEPRPDEPLSSVDFISVLPACRQCVALQLFVRKHRSRSRRYGEDRGSGEGGIGGRTELVGLVMPVAPPAALPGVNDKGAARRQHGIEIHFRCRELGSAAGALDENAAGVAVNACRLRVRGDRARQQSKESQNMFHVLA